MTLRIRCKNCDTIIEAHPGSGWATCTCAQTKAESWGLSGYGKVLAPPGIAEIIPESDSSMPPKPADTAPDQQAHTLDDMPAEMKSMMIAALERDQKHMTVLAMYAQHGSCSYGEISAARLRSILHGDTPTDAERVRFEQAMLEMPANAVPDLAAEIGMTAAEIEKRTMALCGHAPGVRWS